MPCWPCFATCAGTDTPCWQRSWTACRAARPAMRPPLVPTPGDAGWHSHPDFSLQWQLPEVPVVPSGPFAPGGQTAPGLPVPAQQQLACCIGPADWRICGVGREGHARMYRARGCRAAGPGRSPAKSASGDRRTQPPSVPRSAPQITARVAIRRVASGEWHRA